MINNCEPTILEISRDTGLSTKGIEKTLLVMSPQISFDSEIESERSEDSMHEVIMCENTNGEIESNYLNNSLKHELDKILGVLDKDELKVVRLRHGLDGESMTLKDIGILMGLSSERIRTIQNSAMFKLRCSDEIEKLEDYLYN